MLVLGRRRLSGCHPKAVAWLRGVRGGLHGWRGAPRLSACCPVLPTLKSRCSFWGLVVMVCAWGSRAPLSAGPGAFDPFTWGQPPGRPGPGVSRQSATGSGRTWRTSTSPVPSQSSHRSHASWPSSPSHGSSHRTSSAMKRPRPWHQGHRSSVVIVSPPEFVPDKHPEAGAGAMA